MEAEFERTLQPLKDDVERHVLKGVDGFLEAHIAGDARITLEVIGVSIPGTDQPIAKQIFTRDEFRRFIHLILYSLQPNTASFTTAAEALHVEAPLKKAQVTLNVAGAGDSMEARAGMRAHMRYTLKGRCEGGVTFAEAGVRLVPSFESQACAVTVRAEALK